MIATIRLFLRRSTVCLGLAWMVIWVWPITCPSAAAGRNPPNNSTLPASKPAQEIQIRFVQVAPGAKEKSDPERSKYQDRAVVLVPGFHPHPFSAQNIQKPCFQGWQKPGSKLVDQLGKHADVFAVAYSQSGPIEEIPGVRDFKARIQELKRLGYQEIILIGHSAGGLIVRQFVEDYPDAGVTAVIQICTPNEGSTLAKIEDAVRKPQRIFMNSLTKEARAECCQRRADKKVPKAIQFVCIVGQKFDTGDGIVSTKSQWPKDLQDQGIPALRLKASHFTVMRSETEVEQIARCIEEKFPRWSAREVAAAREKLGIK